VGALEEGSTPKLKCGKGLFILTLRGFVIAVSGGGIVKGRSFGGKSCSNLNRELRTRLVQSWTEGSK